MACSNQLCGHTFVAHFEAIRTVSPSAIPHEDVYLPMSAHAKSLLLKQRSLTEEGQAADVRFRPEPKPEQKSIPQ